MINKFNEPSNGNIILDNLKISNGMIYYGKNKIKIPKGLCLDLGCGDFEYESEYKTKVIGIDNSTNLMNKNFIRGDLKSERTWNKIENQSIDFITSVGVLHWIPNINYIFKKCNLKLKYHAKMFHIFWNENNFKKNVLELLSPDTYQYFIKFKNLNHMLITNLKLVEQQLIENNFNIINLELYRTNIYIDNKTPNQYIQSIFRPKAEFIIVYAEKVK